MNGASMLQEAYRNAQMQQPDDGEKFAIKVWSEYATIVERSNDIEAQLSKNQVTTWAEVQYIRNHQIVV